MNGSMMMHTAIGAGLGTLGMLAILMLTGGLHGALGKWLLLAGAAVGGLAAYLLSGNQAPAPTVPNPYVSNAVTDIPSQSGIAAFETSPGTTDAPGPDMQALIQQYVYSDGSPAADAQLQNTLNQGADAMTSVGIAPQTAKTEEGLASMLSLQVNTAPSPVTAADLASKLQLTVIAPQPPNEDYRPLSQVTVIDLAPVLKGITSPAKATQDGAYMHQGTTSRQ